MRNIESKFRCDDHEGVRARALEMGARDEGLLEQRDRFFEVPRGRLKLRIEGDRGTLIAYDRPDRPEARGSEYSLFPTEDPEALEEALSLALPAGPEVHKHRHLLLLSHTRVHLDDVAGLGRFVELETVLDDGDWDPWAEHAQIVTSLGLEHRERVAVAYADLLRM